MSGEGTQVGFSFSLPPEASAEGTQVGFALPESATYTPPDGLAVGFRLGSVYVPPPGSQVGFDYHDDTPPPADYQFELIGVAPAAQGLVELDAIALTVNGYTVEATGSIVVAAHSELGVTGQTPIASGSLALSAPTAILSGQTAPASGALALLAPALLSLAGQTPSASGQLELLAPALFDVSGTTPTPSGALVLKSPELKLDGRTLGMSGSLALIGEVFAQAQGLTPPLSGQMALAIPGELRLIGQMSPPSGAVSVQTIFVPDPEFAVQGRTPALTGTVSLNYDAEIPVFMSPVVGTRWDSGTRKTRVAHGTMQDAALALHHHREVGQDAAQAPHSTRQAWQDAAPAPVHHRTGWQQGRSHSQRLGAVWNDADRVWHNRRGSWQSALLLTAEHRTGWGVALPFSRAAFTPWQGATPLSRFQFHRIAQLPRRSGATRPPWQSAAYPKNLPNFPKHPEPPPEPPEWGNPDPILLIRSHYMALNSVSLKRLPDGMALPVTSMTIETDFDSWCWSLSAQLVGPNAWALVQPNPLACEVEAEINGLKWKFLLDVPNHQRAFNSNQVTLKGRSRSAWLHTPFAMPVNRSAVDARDMTQVANAALDTTGWTLDWGLPDWSIPAGRYNSNTTAIGALLRLVQTTGDGLYTHPHLQVLYAQPRWPVPSWQLDSATVQYTVPESVLLTLSKSPVYTPPINGVYVSGTSHGVLALVKIMQTDGALLGEMVSDELLCDSHGVAARQRGINLLSNAGAGFEYDVDMPLIEEIGVIPPGRIVSIAGVKGVSRSCRISASWSSGLVVRQAIGFERREREL